MEKEKMEEPEDMKTKDEEEEEVAIDKSEIDQTNDKPAKEDALPSSSITVEQLPTPEKQDPRTNDESERNRLGAAKRRIRISKRQDHKGSKREKIVICDNRTTAGGSVLFDTSEVNQEIQTSEIKRELSPLLSEIENVEFKKNQELAPVDVVVKELDKLEKHQENDDREGEETGMAREKASTYSDVSPHQSRPYVPIGDIEEANSLWKEVLLSPKGKGKLGLPIQLIDENQENDDREEEEEEEEEEERGGGGGGEEEEPEIPRELENIILEEKGGTDPRLVFQKKLAFSDVDPKQARLRVPIREMESKVFLAEEEKELLHRPKGEGMSTQLIEPYDHDNNCYYVSPITLKKWTNCYALKIGCNEIVKSSNLVPGETVQLWSFRDSDSDLWFALVKLQ